MNSNLLNSTISRPQPTINPQLSKYLMIGFYQKK